ncbi:MAG: hypothetical protein ACRDPR_18990, partial [Nocardioidaceae bacterium]
ASGWTQIEIAVPADVAAVEVQAGDYIGGRVRDVRERSAGAAYRDVAGPRLLEMELRPRGDVSFSIDYTSPSGALFRASRAGATGEWRLALRVRGLDAVPATDATYREVDLIAKRSFTYVLAWNGSTELERLRSRGCFVQAEANDEMTILAVRPGCRSEQAR